MAMIFEANHVDTLRSWSIDTEAIAHVYSGKDFVSSYKQVEEKKLNIGKQASSNVAGVGEVVLEMTCGQELLLNDVLRHILGSIFVSSGFRVVFKCAKMDFCPMDFSNLM